MPTKKRKSVTVANIFSLHETEMLERIAAERGLGLDQLVSLAVSQFIQSYEKTNRPGVVQRRGN